MITMGQIGYIIIYFLLLVFFMMLQKIMYHTFRTPITVFSGLWAIVGIVSNCGFVGFYYPSDLVNVCMISGIIFFSLCYMFLVKPNKILITEQFEFDQSETVNYRLIYVLMGIALVFYIPKTIVAFKLIRNYGMTFVRANLTNKELGLSNGALWDNFFAYMISPILIAISILTSVLIFSDQPKKKVYPLFFASIITMALGSISSASRAEFFRFVFCLIVSLMVCRRQMIRELFHNKIFARGFLIAIIAVLIVTFQRALSNRTWWENLQKTFYLYFFSGPSYMTQLLENVDEYGPRGTLLYGSATFGFVTNFVSIALTIVTHRSQGSLYIMGSKLTNVQYSVGPYAKANAMSTCYYNFLLDWSYLGIFLGPVILASFAAFFTQKAYNKKTIKDVSIYIFFLYVLFRTCFKLEMVSVGFTMTLFYLSLFTKTNGGEERIRESEN